MDKIDPTDDVFFVQLVTVSKRFIKTLKSISTGVSL